MPAIDSFAAASMGALADIEGASASPDTPAPSPTDAAPTPSTPVEDTPSPTPLSTPATPLAPEEWEMKWNGQTLKVNREQAIKLAQQGFDYTQKTQQAAEDRKALAAERDQLHAEKAQLAKALQDPSMVKAHYERLLAAAGQSADPNEVPTMGQMQQALQTETARMRAEMKAEADRAIATATARLESTRMESDYTQEAETTLTAVLDQHDILKTIDDVQDLLRKDAWRTIVAKQKVDENYAPSKGDVRQAIVEAAKNRAEKLEAKIKDHEKMAVARQAKLTTHGTEPPGGKIVIPSATQHYKLGSKDLRAAAIADIEASMRAATS